MIHSHPLGGWPLQQCMTSPLSLSTGAVSGLLWLNQLFFFYWNVLPAFPIYKGVDLGWYWHAFDVHVRTVLLVNNLTTVDLEASSNLVDISEGQNRQVFVLRYDGLVLFLSLLFIRYSMTALCSWITKAYSSCQFCSPLAYVFRPLISACVVPPSTPSFCLGVPV